MRLLLLRGRVQGAVLIGETGERGARAHERVGVRGHNLAPAPYQHPPTHPSTPPPPPCTTHADLEEACENLILDQLDVGGYGPQLLDPDFELDHVFD